MATFLDITGLQHFSQFFVFIFVWLLMYVILGASKIAGENKGIHIILGLVIALLTLLSPTVTGAIAYISPWFAILFVLAIFIIMSIKLFGVSASEFVLSGQVKGVIIAVIFMALILGTLAYVREQTTIPDGEDVDYSKSMSIIFHPKVLGMVFVLVIAVFTIVLMAGKQT